MLLILFQFCWWNLESCGCLSDILPMSSVHGSDLLIFYLMFMHAYNVFGSNPISNYSPFIIFLPSLCSYSLYLFLSLIFKFNVHSNHCCLCVQIYSVTYSHQVAQPGLELILELSRPWRWHLPTSAYWIAEITLLYHQDFYHYSWCVKHKEIKKYIYRIDKNSYSWLILNLIGTFFSVSEFGIILD